MSEGCDCSGDWVYTCREYVKLLSSWRKGSSAIPIQMKGGSQRSTPGHENPDVTKPKEVMYSTVTLTASPRQDSLDSPA